MKYSELHRKLRRAGCYQIDTNRHPWWFSPITGNRFQTSHHESEEVAPGTKKAIEILRNADMLQRVIDMRPYKDPDEFIKTAIALNDAIIDHFANFG